MFGPQTVQAAQEWLKWTWKWCHPLEILENWDCWSATAPASVTHGSVILSAKWKRRQAFVLQGMACWQCVPFHDRPLQFAARSSHECNMGNARVKVYLLKCDTSLLNATGASMTQLCCSVEVWGVSGSCSRTRPQGGCRLTIRSRTLILGGGDSGGGCRLAADTSFRSQKKI